MMVTCDTLMPRLARSALMARGHALGVQLSDAAQRLLLLGDRHQLPAVVVVREAERRYATAILAVRFLHRPDASPRAVYAATRLAAACSAVGTPFNLRLIPGA